MRAVMVSIFLLLSVLASPALGRINVELTASGPIWNGGPAVMPAQSMTVHIWVPFA